jgi:hypothetical protein
MNDFSSDIYIYSLSVRRVKPIRPLSGIHLFKQHHHLVTKKQQNDLFTALLFEKITLLWHYTSSLLGWFVIRSRQNYTRKLLL